MEIPQNIIPEVYNVARRVYDGDITKLQGRALLSRTINPTTADFYISNFKNMMNGKVFKKTLNAKSMDYFLNRIYHDYASKLPLALSALEQHITYYEGKQKSTMHVMRALHEKYSTNAFVNTLITNTDQLVHNIETIESLLTEGSEEERQAASDLIKRGVCFVAYQVENEIRFAPSRFIGYINNNLLKHESSYFKHGSQTNEAINSVLNSSPKANLALEKKYLEYCAQLGIEALEKVQSSRKFWPYKLLTDFTSNSNLPGDFPEGKIFERTHKARERNQKLVQIAKKNFKDKHGKLYCEACNFDFEHKYKALGKDFIEAHHIIPVCDMQPGHTTKIKDLIMLCSNCHRMIHKKRPWLTRENLHLLFE